MRNLIRFIVRNHILFLFLILEIVCITLIFRQKNYHHVQMTNASAGVTGSVYQSYSEVTDYLYLKQVNDSLARVLANYKMHQLERDTLAAMEPGIVSADTLPFQYIPARVVKSSYTNFNNYLTINKGRNDSISGGMGVVSPHGVVGIVVGASENFASVMSLLHHEIRISCKLKKNEQQGTLIWEGMNPNVAYLDYLTEPADLEEGDTLVTSGASTFFPPGEIVGTINEFELAEGANFYKIQVRLSSRFDRLKHVFVIKNKLQNEQQQLEEGTQR